VQRVPKLGGDYYPIAGMNSFEDIATDDAFVYWASIGTGIQRRKLDLSAEVETLMTLEGVDPDFIALSPYGDVRVDPGSGTAWWVQNDSQVRRHGWATGETTVFAPKNACQLFVAAGAVVWHSCLHDGRPYEAYFMPVDGRSPTRLATAGDRVLAVDDEYVYSARDNVIRRQKRPDR
jgi:hypothetical protein